MTTSDNFLRHIRQKHNLKTAFSGIHVYTIYGESGVIQGGEGNLIRIYLDSSKTLKSYHPDEILFPLSFREVENV